MPSPADEARNEGRVVVARVTHSFAPGWVEAPIKRAALTDGRLVRYPLHQGRQGCKPDPLRCRVCGRLEGHPTHGGIG